MSNTIQMIFEDRHGRPVPRLPRDADGRPRANDPLKYLTLELAAAQFRVPEAELRQLWLDFMEDFIGREDGQPLGGDGGLRADAIRRAYWPILSPEFFEQFSSEADRLRLDMRNGEIGAKLEKDERTGKAKLAIFLKIQGFRRLAHRSGKYVGLDDIAFGPTDEYGRPEWARATVRKMVKGRVCKFVRTVFWSESAPRRPGDDWFFDEFPRMALGYRAEVAALKAAFPKQIGNLRLPDEGDPSALRGDPATPKPKRPAPPLEPGIGAPTTRIQGEAEMVAMGLTEPIFRDSVIDQLKAKFRDVYNGNEASFWGLATNYLKRNRGEFERGLG